MFLFFSSEMSNPLEDDADWGQQQQRSPSLSNEVIIVTFSNKTIVEKLMATETNAEENIPFELGKLSPR